MRNFEVDGIEHDFSHLNASHLTVANKGKNGDDLHVAIVFTTHVFSESCDFDSRDMVDENGKPRAFCPDRYEHSKKLPNLVRQMIQENFYCWKSEDRNNGMNYAVIDIAPTDILAAEEAERFVLYFYIYPSKGEGAADIVLKVTSCYRKLLGVDARKRRFNMHTVLRQCLFNQKRCP